VARRFVPEPLPDLRLYHPFSSSLNQDSGRIPTKHSLTQNIYLSFHPLPMYDYKIDLSGDTVISLRPSKNLFAVWKPRPADGDVGFTWAPCKKKKGKEKKLRGSLEPQPEPEPEASVRFLVSSRHLILASPVIAPRYQYLAAGAKHRRMRMACTRLQPKIGMKLLSPLSSTSFTASITRSQRPYHLKCWPRSPPSSTITDFTRRWCWGPARGLAH